VTADVFGTAPRELTRSITLRQTLDLVRSVVDVVEQDATALAEPGEEQALREAVLRYSREIAFAAAEVYAHAAEARGAWDARLEGLVVDAVLRGEADDSMQSRAAALGWGSTTRVAVVAGSTPSGSPSGVVDGLRRAAQRVGVDTLAAVQGRRLVCILGNVDDPLGAAREVASHFGDGPLVVGPTVPHLFAAGRSARAALAGQSCAEAWPDAPRPVAADDLLAERVLVGDGPARALLVDRIWHPLRTERGGTLLETASAYLESGGGLEGTARVLFVHPNTVRYRLGKIADLTGYQLTDPHDAHTVRIALALGRLSRSTPARRAAPA
jgi:DNA-binding PucR family transcriptional regulator